MLIPHVVFMVVKICTSQTLSCHILSHNLDTRARGYLGLEPWIQLYSSLLQPIFKSPLLRIHFRFPWQLYFHELSDPVWKIKLNITGFWHSPNSTREKRESRLRLKWNELQRVFSVVKLLLIASAGQGTMESKHRKGGLCSLVWMYFCGIFIFFFQ